MHRCRICSRPGVRDWLDFGPQALTNRFLRSADEPEFRHPCRIGACRHCGTVQLGSPVPVAEMRPRFDWIKYHEPERHLDAVCDVVAKLPGLAPASAVGGLTEMDESTLHRLAARGFARPWLAQPRDDLGVQSSLGGIESIQEKLTVPTAERLAARYGRPDVLLARHVLEHAHDPGAVLRAIRALVRPGGYAVFEVPDCRKSLDRLDYTTVWEEHTFYYTPATLRYCLAGAGFEPVFLESFYSPQEDILVAVATPAAAVPSQPPELAGDLERADRFVREFPRVRDSVRQRVRAVTGSGGTFAVLGAGHVSGAFINLYGLGPETDFVADDNPNKQGLFMPGSRAPILPSAELLTRDVRLCLMTVRAEIEDAVFAKNKAFTDRGGVLASVFPESRYAFDKLGPTAGRAA